MSQCGDSCCEFVTSLVAFLVAGVFFSLGIFILVTTQSLNGYNGSVKSYDVKIEYDSEGVITTCKYYFYASDGQSYTCEPELATECRWKQRYFIKKIIHLIVKQI